MAILSNDLTNSKIHDSASDKVVLKLLESDRDLQQTLSKAQQSTLEAKYVRHVNLIKYIHFNTITIKIILFIH